jgi:hypothetical protein
MRSKSKPPPVPSADAVVSTALSEKSTPSPSVEPARNGLVELVVWSVPAVNRMLLICHLLGDEGSNPMNLVSVAVRDNANFLKKMTLKARRISERKFMLEGPCPRWRGKW